MMPKSPKQPRQVLRLDARGMPKQALLLDVRGMLSPKQAFHLAQRDVPEKWMMGLSASYLRVMQQSIPLSLSLGQWRL